MAGLPGSIDRYALSSRKFERLAPARPVNLSIPIVNGIGMSLAGYCRATFRLENGRVAGVAYTGDSDPLEGPNSACGALMRACLSRRS